MSELTTARYDPGHRDDVLRLLEEVWGESPTVEEFEWWFDGNPVGARTIALAEDGGRIVGVLGASHYRAFVGGRETLVTLPLSAATHAAYRGRGIFQRLNAEVERAAHDERATAMLGFTNRMAGPIYVGRLGWLDVHRLRIWARPLLPRSGSDPGTQLRRFVHTQEEAYRALAPSLRNHFVRDTAYLNWRYADSPRAYTILGSKHGYAVVGRKRFKGIETAYVADLVAPTHGETRRLLRRCVWAARGARVLLALMPAVHARAFAAAGFLPTPQTIRLIGRALEGELPLGRGAWHFSLGDTDYF